MTVAAQRVARRLARSPFRRPAVLRRQTPGHRNDRGRFVPGKVVDIAVMAVTAPLGGEERQVLPEGLRERDVRSFWLTERVDAVRQGSTGTGGDQIVYDGVTYQLFQVQAWGGWYECVGVAQQ